MPSKIKGPTNTHIITMNIIHPVDRPPLLFDVPSIIINGFA
jgi:hypothetical protein